MLIKTFGAAVFGVNAIVITIEVFVENGVHFLLVGLPDNAVKESQQRIGAALKQNGYKIPGKKIVINMAPADIRKEGSAYDLPIAMGILAASGQITSDKIGDYLLMGELSLDGSLAPVKGALPMAIEAKKAGFKGIILPACNANEAAIVAGIEVLPAENILDVIGFFNETFHISPLQIDLSNVFQQTGHFSDSDFADVQGQLVIKRAMEVAAAGGHNLILIGPPGAGKTMLAKRLPSILPPLSLEEALEATKIHSVAGKLDKNKALINQRPFRAPHHTISDVALVGGGAHPQPGEISLAHHGVLFLDELPEFKRSVLEVLRQPLEERKINISRARHQVAFPASFMLVASMNPCPCGYFNHPEKSCVCGITAVQKYLNKVSGPLLDRIDIHIEVRPVAFDELSQKKKAESSALIQQRVTSARLIQSQRFAEQAGIFCNAQMTKQMIQQFCELDQTGQILLKRAMEKLNLSARAYDRILKLARSIADLSGEKNIQNAHLAEAIQYRSLDKSSLMG